MNILLTTLGFSWQIIPELYGFTNPERSYFFSKSETVKKIREDNNIQPIDEIWVVTISASSDNVALESCKNWAKRNKVEIKIIQCSNATDFSDENQVLEMRACIYKSVLTALKFLKEKGKLYVSIAGGRKTMSSDIQQAAMLFGCDALLHIMDLPAYESKKKDFESCDFSLIESGYNDCFLPIVFSGKINQSELFINHEKELCEFSDIVFDGKNNCFVNGIEILNLIDKLQKQSGRLFGNFAQSLEKYSYAGTFRRILYLPNDVIDKIKKTKLKYVSFDLIKKLPKSDLHSHFGGVLTPHDMVEVALFERKKSDYSYQKNSCAKKAIAQNNIDELINEKRRITAIDDRAIRFREIVSFLCEFKRHIDLLEKTIFDGLDCKGYFKVGIEKYQTFGDLQGSGLLQTEYTIEKAIEKYIMHLKEDNVRYLELRCSPHKYTYLGLTMEQVVKIILAKLNKAKIEYRLIFIIGRNAKKDEMINTVKSIVSLRSSNSDFKKRFVAVDLAGTEGVVQPKELREVFLPLLKECIAVTIHAGETETVENIWQAVYYLSADRIGHGLKLTENKELLLRFKDKRIGIELCPSSNRQVVGVTCNNYPLKVFLKKDLKVTINTDNMGISKTNVTNEFFVADKLVHSGITLWDCIVLIRNSISVAFVDMDTKQKLMRNFEEEIVSILEKYFGVNIK